MSRPPQYAQRKDANQSEIVSALEAIGCDVWVMHQPVDLLCGFRGRSLLLEVKDGKKSASRRKLTPAQAKFHASWRGHKATVKTPQEAIDAVLKGTGAYEFNSADLRESIADFARRHIQPAIEQLRQSGRKP